MKKSLYDHTTSDYLDPQTCGSSIRCSANVYRKNSRLCVDVFAELKDCTRTIEWTGYGADGLLAMEKKLTVAITHLTKLRAATCDAGRVYLKAKGKRK